ncbi:arginine--tRNA ligase [Gorillibacterium massiliense]|uniref:arginine--tRNA ligase n=1 Tax=Gorillibacterium massiliense TaxID=1280390 RepID=UPI00059442BA|nr:arginine--tRNA ligase [Gorillibacterium massiliense]
MIRYKKLAAAAIANTLEGVSEEDVFGLLEYPPNPEMGDLSMPCFKLSKALRKAPQAIAEGLKEQFSEDAFERAEAVSGYLNLFLDKSKFAVDLIGDILSAGDTYGSADIGKGQSVVIDYSSPNIAKPFHIGHLRSTVIGNALRKIHAFLGFNVVGVNHLGDWGTQFGKLIVAYQKWGNAEKVEAEGITELLRLYVYFHEQAEKEPALEDEARAWFTSLERGDAEAFKLWQWFVDISLKEFEKIYSLLNVSFDAFTGESFYMDKMGPVIERMKELNLLEEDEGTMLVRLDEFNMPPALMLKKDGSSLYHTRDMAAALYRKDTYHFVKSLYVTSYAQNLHFQQLFKVIEKMGYDWADQLIHVPFGQVSLEGASLSTRKGNVVMLEDLLNQAIAKTREIIETKNANLENKDEVARQVGVGAIIFNDLYSNRIKDVVFSWEEALNFDGETGPYAQYTHARACSVLRKAGNGESIDLPAGVTAATLNPALLQNPEAQGVLSELARFGERVEQAMEKLEPSIISRYVIDVCQAFNRFYHGCPILVDDIELRNARLALVKCVQITLRNGLALIGLETPEKI